MAKFNADLKDIEFNLFDYIKADEKTDAFEKQDLRDVLNEFYKFTEAEIYPTRTESEYTGVKLDEDGVKVPECLKQVQSLFYENGWFGLGLPEDLGGIPVPESVSVACSSLATGANTAWMMYPGLSRAALNVILKVGSDWQKNAYVEKMMTGQWGGTMCLTESEAGSDVGALRSTAEPIGDGKYKIKGVKIFISSGDNDLYENIVHLVLARTPEGKDGSKGISLFLVPKYKVDKDGNMGAANDVVCTKIEEKMGLHASATCEITFGNQGDCEGYMIGNEFEGMANMFIMMNEARLLCGLQGEAQGNLANEHAVQHAQERSQFGKNIIDHPDVRRMLLRNRALGRGLRALTLYTAGLMDDQHKSGSQEELDEIGLLTPICKAYCSDEGFQMAVDTVQVHGGYGYCWEYKVEQFLRDSKVAKIYEGTNGIQAIDFVMRKILKDGGKTFTKVGQKIAKTLQNPKAAEFQNTVKQLGISLQKAGDLAQEFGKRAQSGKIDDVLKHCTEFQTFCSHLIVGWLLLEHAILAQEKLSSASSPEDKKFLQSKIDDVNLYTQYFLSRNLGLYKSMSELELNLMDIEL